MAGRARVWSWLAAGAVLMAAACSGTKLPAPDDASAVSTATVVDGASAVSTSTVAPTSAAVSTSTAPATTTVPAAPSGPLVEVTSFGAHGDGRSDDTAAIQAALDSLDAGETLVFRAGRFVYGAVLRVRRPDTALWGAPGAVLAASDPAQEALSLEADRTSVRGLTLEASATQRMTGLEQHRIVIEGTTGSIVEGVHVVGGSAAGIFANGATDYTITGNTVERTLADGIHNTFGSHGGTVKDNVVADTGDDCIAVVSYLGDDAMTTDVTIEHNWCTNSRARGISVVGGQDVTIVDNQIDTTAAAGIYLASEGSFDTYAPARVRIHGNSITRANSDRRIEHAAIFAVARRGSATVAGARVSLQIDDVVIDSNVISDTLTSSHDITFLDARARNVVIRDNTIVDHEGRQPISLAVASADYVLSNNTLNGAPLRDHPA